MHVAAISNFTMIMACEYPGSLWLSSDFGVSFSNATSPPGPPRYWTSAEHSADGRIWLATVEGEYLWVSTDYANTWKAQTNLGNETRYGNSLGNWTDCNVSPDGTVMAALDSFGYIWQYRNGVWAPLYGAGRQPWVHISMDQDGSIMGTVVEWGHSYFSDNWGIPGSW